MRTSSARVSLLTPFEGSSEEVEDIKRAYMDTDGVVGEIMNHIPHSTYEDEPRLIGIIASLIDDGKLKRLKKWESSVKDEKAKLVRRKQGENEAAEAEELAKELGVWDEFYGSGNSTQKKGKGKGKKAAESAGGDDEEDYSALQAMMLAKKKKSEGFFDSLAAKYAEPETKGRAKGKKRGRGDEGDGGKAPPEINDEEFQKLQQKLFGGEREDTTRPARKAKTSRVK